jgi:glycosyltransferase 2 family protein
MGKKRVLITAVVVALLGILIYTQFREWRNFDWPTFWAQTHQIRGIHIIHGIALIYIHYGLRALRWRIFLKPLKKTSWLSLLPSTLIGFTGLALLGRPGEFIRPYLISRRVNLSFSSQLAVWTVERIFDLGAFTVLMVGAIFASKGLRTLSFYAQFREIGFVLMAGVTALAVVAVVVARNGNRLADWLEVHFSRISKELGKKVATKIREFGLGLNTIDGFWAFAQISAVSVAMWYLIALAYREVTHAYMIPSLQHLTTSRVLLLMGSSMVGSMVQLPAVGGGSQVATISALSAIFNVPKESAVSCGILLWLVTFMSVAPLGLALAHRARLSLRQLSAESSQEEAATTLP